MGFRPWQFLTTLYRSHQGALTQRQLRISRAVLFKSVTNGRFCEVVPEWYSRVHCVMWSAVDMLCGRRRRKQGRRRATVTEPAVKPPRTGRPSVRRTPSHLCLSAPPSPPPPPPPPLLLLPISRLIFIFVLSRPLNMTQLGAITVYTTVSLYLQYWLQS